MARKRVSVIGSGPGGYVGAIRLAQLGHEVTIFEKDSIGGVCLNVGCIPSKALLEVAHHMDFINSKNPFGLKVNDYSLDFERAQKWKDKQVVAKLTAGIDMLLKKNNVTIIKGEAKFVNKNQLAVGEQTYDFDEAIIATGSRPIELKSIPYSENVVDSTGALNFKSIPKELVVVGGGYIGCELASAYAALGSKVTIVEAADSILINFDKDMVDLVVSSFEKAKVEILTNAFVEKVVDDGRCTSYVKVNDEVIELSSEKVLVSIGRKPNTDQLNLNKAGVELLPNGLVKVNEYHQTTASHIYAIGDVVEGLALAHKASFEAKVVAENISGKKHKVEYLAMPAVCFVSPECASVGIDLQSMDKEKHEIANFPFQANGRSISLNSTRGFVRLISEKDSKVVVGAQIVGNYASELITQCALAIENELTLDDIALTVHPHPTVAESIMDASEIGLGLPIHL